MAHFIGFACGNRGEASRLGSKDSGMDARASGWNIGGRVIARHDEGKDNITFLIDGGSNGHGNSSSFAQFEEIMGGKRRLKNLNGFELTHIGEDYCKVERGSEEYELPLIVAEIFDIK